MTCHLNYLTKLELTQTKKTLVFRGDIKDLTKFQKNIDFLTIN
jgi:hypothetical protein